ncbi:MAG TPA: glutathione S-transferase N-terminal domain-containing protein, partial [Solirubrobacteraceae bacterium]|nr:glutathione S-transferase N-terminal domain-containing protein [Solirubrobacteraceae bacterium]
RQARCEPLFAPDTSIVDNDPAVKLYVCYGTFGPGTRHPCARAHRALVAAGYTPEVIRTYGCYGTDRLFRGRCAVKRLTGNYKVPTLVLDDDTVVDESDKIVAWAEAHQRT